MKVLVAAATGGLGRRVAAALARLPQCTGVRGLVRDLEPEDPSQRQVGSKGCAPGVVVGMAAGAGGATPRLIGASLLAGKPSA